MTLQTSLVFICIVVLHYAVCFALPSNTNFSSDPSSNATASNSALQCYPRQMQRWPMALHRTDCYYAARSFAHVSPHDYLHLVNRHAYRDTEIQAPWTYVAGKCLFKLSLLGRANEVPVIKTIVDFAAMSLLNDCIERPGTDGGRFLIARDDEVMVELRHAGRPAGPYQDE